MKFREFSENESYNSAVAEFSTVSTAKSNSAPGAPIGRFGATEQETKRAARKLAV